ncbi:MAG TPA: undecaprenyl-diphosphate phosphatase, partial [Thermoleophilaceae bacterium]|nr:undecaprenyl-diphosphate phosphatase [Thermoleophilaceae bacterium]
VPAVVLSGLLELGTLIRGEEGESTTAVGLVIATLLAFVSGYASIAFLLRWLTSHSMEIFVVYRVVLGALVLALVGAGVIE